MFVKHVIAPFGLHMVSLRGWSISIGHYFVSIDHLKAAVRVLLWPIETWVGTNP